MAKEHEKIPKVNNAPRKICSWCEIVSNGNVTCTTFRAVGGCRGSKAPDFEGLVFLGKETPEAEPFCPVSQRTQMVRSARLISHHRGWICTAHLQGEWEAQVANWILITSRRLFRTTVLFHSSEKSTDICRKKFLFWQKITAASELTFKTDI